MKRPTKKLALASCAMIAIVAPFAAHAQAAPAATEDSQEFGGIIVTAQKRSERLQDVPMSITAASSDDLRSLGITTTEDLGKLVTGFSSTTSHFGFPVYFIRGVGFFESTLGVSPAVTVYTDQIPLPYSPMSRGATLDLERVEVLKGPQGTLFGQNSTGGAINYIAARPTDRLESGIELTGGRFRKADIEAFVSGPISNTLKARIAVRHESQDDWQYNYITGEGNGKKRFINGRFLLDWNPTATARFSFSATGWHDTSEVPQGQFVQFEPLTLPADGGRPYDFPIDTFPSAPDNARATAFDPGRDLSRDDRMYQFALRGDIDLTDAITLTSLTSYAEFRTFAPLDHDKTIYPNGVVDTTGTIKTFSQELRVAGEAGSIKWMIGGNYQKDNVDERFIRSEGHDTGSHIGPINFSGFVIDNFQKISTTGVFGSLDYEISPELTLQAAARYTKQDRDYTGCTRDDGTGTISAAFSLLSSLFTGQPQTIAPGACVSLGADFTPQDILTGKLDEDNLSWRASINYKPSESSLVYANVTKGYKAGSFPTLPTATADQVLPVPQESVLAYEIGGKTSLANRTIDVSGAAFYYDYHDKQLLGFRVVPPFGPLPGLVTIPKSRIWGVEGSVSLRPMRGLTVNGGLIYVNTKVQSDPAVPTGPFGNTGSFVGRSFPFTPEWQGTLDAEYRMPVSSSTSAFVGGTVTGRSGTDGSLLTGSAAVAAKEALVRIPGYTLLDLRAGLTSEDDKWRLEIWARNVTNKFYLTAANRNSDYIYRFTGMPATYGLTVRFRFDQ